MNNFNVILSTLTVAGLIGLLIANPSATVQVFNALGSNANNYVKTVQGR
jgi:hypothetical protein